MRLSFQVLLVEFRRAFFNPFYEIDCFCDNFIHWPQFFESRLEVT